MQFEKDPRNRFDHDLEEEKKEEFSFLQETIKPEPVTKKRILFRLGKLAVYGLILGIFSCLGFYALKPWLENQFPLSPKTVTIPEDTEAENDVSKQEQQEEEPDQELDSENYEEIMDSIYEIAQDVEKSVVTVQAEKDAADWTKDEMKNQAGSTGVIAADNGQELLILADSSVCENASAWSICFSDGSEYQASLKKQDKNTGLAVFGIKKSVILSSTWDAAKVASLGNSNIITSGETVIALGDTFGYPQGVGYGIISSNDYEESTADYTFSVLATDIPCADDSTGVLCNLDGEIVGLIDSVIWSESGGHTANAFAISDLKPIMQILLNGESVPYIGILGLTVDADISEERGIPRGMYVTEVKPGSPAMAAGIQSGDVLQEIDGQSISSVENYEKAIQNSKAGSSIKISGGRLGADGYVDISFNVTVGSCE